MPRSPLFALVLVAALVPCSAFACSTARNATRVSALTATDANAACQSAKLKAVASAAAGLLRCRATAASSGTNPTSECVAKYHDALATKFASAEKNTCATVSDEAPAASAIDSFVTLAGSALHPTSTPSKCASDKLLAVAKDAATLFKAYAIDRRRSEGTKLLAFAAKACTALGASFSHADAGNDCLTHSDETAADFAVTDFGARVAGVLSK